MKEDNMLATRLAAIALAAVTLTLPAMAQNEIRLDDFDADRINATQIKIEFEYQGSACETVEPAVLGEITDGTLFVTIPTTATAEMCTQQLVEIEVEQAIEADESVQRVTVTLLRPDNSVLASETAEVDND
jgi:hypothetical protein